jgi:hypothetical protein
MIKMLSYSKFIRRCRQESNSDRQVEKAIEALVAQIEYRAYGNYLDPIHVGDEADPEYSSPDHPRLGAAIDGRLRLSSYYVLRDKLRRAGWDLTVVPFTRTGNMTGVAHFTRLYVTPLH